MTTEPAANPQGEAAPYTEQTSVEKVAKMLERPAPTRTEQPKAEKPKEDPKANQPEKTKAKAEVKAQPDSDPEEPEAAEGEQPDAPVEGDEPPLELPETLEDLADALGLKPEDFLAKVKGKVKVNGVEQHVNLAEALKGYQLEADYRQKTAQLNESKSRHETEIQQANEAVSQKIQMADDVLRAIVSQFPMPSEGEMRQLLNENPIEYSRVKAELDLRRENFTRAWQAIQAHRNEEAEKQRQLNWNARKEQQEKLALALPVFTDEQKRPAYEANVKTALKQVGYTDQEIAAYFSPENVFDHRHLILVDKAMKWDAFEAGKKSPDIKKRLQGLPPVKAKPNPSSDTQKEDTRAALRERLRKRGSRRGGAEDVSVELVKTML